MQQEPAIGQRGEVPYAGIRMQFPMDGFAAAVDEAFPELFGWLAEHGVRPAGPPFIRYHVIDMPAELDVDFGVPVPDRALAAPPREWPPELTANRTAACLLCTPGQHAVIARR
jgi:hypothetical protein